MRKMKHSCSQLFQLIGSKESLIRGSVVQAVHMLSRSSDVHFASCIIYLSPGIETELGSLSTLWSMY